MKFSSYIVKIVSPCNLNCSYCYEYNSKDDSWKKKPKIMSEEVAEKLAERILEHSLGSKNTIVPIIFHGGEPLMAGLDHIQKLVNIFKKKISPHKKIEFGMQTNGTLITPEHINFFEKERIAIGLSCDGPPDINDIYRVNHSGHGLGHKVDTALNLLKKSSSFNTILCVINPLSDPIKVWNYFKSFNPKSIDFLLPHATYDELPQNWKTGSTIYANWMLKIFDLWYSGDHSHIRIRTFEEFIKGLSGGIQTLESFGINPVTLIIVATDGAYEGVDTLKVTGSNNHVLGMDVFKNSFDDASLHPKVTMRQLGISGLSQTCKMCEYKKVCGGGYLPHRYSNEKKFNNPSIYCEDIKKMISHIYENVKETLINDKKKQSI